ncbi:MAG: matrixin family metalloprotease [Pirellulales bacterium]|nr:matrixin family metalloprotease [Pirellulales bacterium]
MNAYKSKYAQGLALGAWALAIAVPLSTAFGYVPNSRWTATASGAAGSAGDPITLTWSLAPNGAAIPSRNPSNLISYLDGAFGAGVGGSDYTLRPWFSLISDSFDRWSELGGVLFVYEPHDDGLQLTTASGVLGARGDIRIGGANVDGVGGTLAYANFPDVGDMVIDTGESANFTDATNNYRSLRNTLMHELGHAIGLDHVESSTDRLLMEPFIDTAYDGPQLDDIRGLHGQYGDGLEKSFGGLGNDAPQRATSLGPLAAGETRTVGKDAATGQTVGPTEIDFVSIANSGDYDYFSFSVAAPSLLSVELTPRGGVFFQAAQGGQQSSFDANARNDLALDLYGPDGTTLLATANSAAAGVAESIAEVLLEAAEQYFVRVSGTSASVQLYELSLTAANAAAPSADFDFDGDVDGVDFLAWQQNLGKSGPSLAGDANHDAAVDPEDLAIFHAQFGNAPGGGDAATAVPEPGATAYVVVAAIGALAFQSRAATKRAAPGGGKTSK